MSTNDDERQARIDAIRARVEAATPGPWQEQSQDDYACGTYSSVWAIPPGKPKVEVIATDWNDAEYPQPRQEDCDLIANAPADLAWLLSELEAATARAERAEAERNSFAAAHDTARRVAVVNVGTYRGGVNRWRCRVCGGEDFTSFSVPHADDCVVGAMERAYSAALWTDLGTDERTVTVRIKSVVTQPKRGRRAESIVPAFCPFCGVEYRPRRTGQEGDDGE